MYFFLIYNIYYNIFLFLSLKFHSLVAFIQHNNNRYFSVAILFVSANTNLYFRPFLYIPFTQNRKVVKVLCMFLDR